MSTFDRIYELHAILLSRRYPISMRELQERLECSQPTVKRTISKLRSELAAPVRFDPKLKGYILDRAGGDQCELPGLWFSLSELHALLTVHELLSRMHPIEASRPIRPRSPCGRFSGAIPPRPHCPHSKVGYNLYPTLEWG